MIFDIPEPDNLKEMSNEDLEKAANLMARINNLARSISMQIETEILIRLHNSPAFTNVLKIDYNKPLPKKRKQTDISDPLEDSYSIEDFK